MAGLCFLNGVEAQALGILHHPPGKPLNGSLFPPTFEGRRQNENHYQTFFTYSIFHKDGLLFAYFEYVGEDFDADMAKMAADPKTQEWWDIMKPMQAPIETRAEGEWWAAMQEVFHTN